MPWKSAFTPANGCLGALRSRSRSLCTAHRCTGVLLHTVESARRSPALPWTMQSSGARSPRSTRPSRKPFQASCDSLPRISRATSCFLPIGEHRQRDQDRHARHPPVHPDPERDRVEVEEGHLEVRERPLLPRLHVALERPDDARDRALREWRRLEQRPQRARDAPRVGAREVGRQDRLVDLADAPLVARYQLRGPLLRAAWSEEPRSRQRQLQRSGRPSQRAGLAPVALSTARLAALVQLDAEHRSQFLLHRLLDGGADVLVDQDPERDLLMHRLQLLDSLAHGVFLRSSPWPATGWWFPNRKNAPFSFSTSPGTRPHRLAVATQLHCQVGQSGPTFLWLAIPCWIVFTSGSATAESSSCPSMLMRGFPTTRNCVCFVARSKRCTSVAGATIPLAQKSTTRTSCVLGLLTGTRNAPSRPNAHASAVRVSLSISALPRLIASN